MFSLNEIEVMSKRAARGAGYHWGHAEEAGKAARWLAQCDLPGPELLAQLLTLNDGKRYSDIAPQLTTGSWRAGNGDLCPLLAGAILCDHAAELAGGQVFELEAVAYPLLLAPYAAAALGLTASTTVLSWDDMILHICPHAIAIDGERDQLTTPSTRLVTCRSSKTKDIAASHAKCAQTVDTDDWIVLRNLAQRTLAPATDASRLAGAGAGLTDND